MLLRHVSRHKREASVRGAGCAYEIGVAEWLRHCTWDRKVAGSNPSSNNWKENDIALRWAAMRAIQMFHYCGGKSHKTESITITSERGTSVFSLIRKTGSLHTFWLAKARFETVTHPIGDRARPCLTCPFWERCSRHSATDSPLIFTNVRSVI